MALWLALVEIGKADGGVLYAEEVEGAFAWTAAEAPRAKGALDLVRARLAAEGLAVTRIESIFEATMDDVRAYDRWLAIELQKQETPPRVARGALQYFAAEGEA
mgnify:CR=1 FL=1